MLTILLNGQIERKEKKVFVSKSGKPYTFYTVFNTPFTLLAPPNLKPSLSFSAKILAPDKIWLLETFENKIEEPFLTFGITDIVLPNQNFFLTPEGVKILLNNISVNIGNFKSCFIVGYFNPKEGLIEAQMVKGVEKEKNFKS